MKENKMKIKFLIYTIVVFGIAFLGLTFAWISIQITGTPNPIVSTTTSLKLVFTDSPAVSTSDFEPNESIQKTFTVQNTGTETIKYNLFWEDVVNTYIDQTDLYYTLTVATNGSNNPGNVNATQLPTVATSSIKTNITISPNEIHSYTLRIVFIETGSQQNDNQEKTFSGKIYIEEYVTP